MSVKCMSVDMNFHDQSGKQQLVVEDRTNRLSGKHTKLASHCLTNAAFVVWHSTEGVGTIGFWVSRLQNVPKVRGNVR